MWAFLTPVWKQRAYSLFGDPPSGSDGPCRLTCLTLGLEADPVSPGFPSELCEDYSETFWSHLECQDPGKYERGPCFSWQVNQDLGLDGSVLLTSLDLDFPLSSREGATSSTAWECSVGKTAWWVRRPVLLFMVNPKMSPCQFCHCGCNWGQKCLSKMVVCRCAKYRLWCLALLSLSLFLKISFIHMCMECLGHFSPLPPLPPFYPTPSLPGRNYFALISDFVEERV
jgi:hypothetical protein